MIAVFSLRGVDIASTLGIANEVSIPCLQVARERDYKLAVLPCAAGVCSSMTQAASPALPRLLTAA